MGKKSFAREYDFEYMVKTSETNTDIVYADSCSINQETRCLVFYDKDHAIVTAYNKDQWLTAKRSDF